MLQNISEAYLASTCLYDFLGAVGRLTGIHLGLMDNDFDDPARTNPIEPDAYTGPMKPCIPLVVENAKRGYLSIPQETELTEELRPILKLTAAFVSKMPEVTTTITTDSGAYLSGMYELLFSTNLERMASLRAQIGLSKFTEKSKPLNCFLINITPYDTQDIPSGLELRLKADFFRDGDVLLTHDKTLVFFHMQPGSELSEDFEAGLEKVLKNFKMIGCASEPIIDPTHDYRLRHHYNQNEHVLLYLKRCNYTGKRLVHFDDYRLVSMVYSALNNANPMIFGKYRYVSNKVMEICRYDAEKETDYFNTLYVYLNSRFSLNETAQTLNIHRNTVVYRVRQLSERFHIDFDSAEECFRMNLSCHVYKIANYLEPEAK